MNCNEKTAKSCGGGSGGGHAGDRADTCQGTQKGKGAQASGRGAWFAKNIPHCLEYARRAKAAGRPIVGILCEFTPRELIMAAGAVPVCLCGGSAETIAAAHQDLPTNLCPLIKSTYGYHVLRSNPFLEMADLVVAETTCDGKTKMYELMGRTRPMYVLELPHKPDDVDALVHWRKEVHKLKAHLEERFATRSTDEALHAAIAVMNRERGLRRKLAELMWRDPPPMTGRELLAFRSSISGIPEDLEQYERALASHVQAPSASEGISVPGAIPSLALGAYKESGSTVSSVFPRSATRVLMTGVPMVRGAERVLETIEAAGGVVVCLENCSGLKPILDDVHADGDPLEAIVQKYFHLPCSVMTPNHARLDLLRRLAREYRPQCVIELIWQACLTYDVESARVRQLVEGELGLPYLRIETDYSPSDSARIALRVEAMFETVRQRACPPQGAGCSSKGRS